MKSFVMKGNILYSKTAERIEAFPNSYLVCEEGICRGVFEQLPPRWKDLPLEDCGNKLIVPGLVDLHIHAPQYAFRGTGMDLELMDWLQQQAFPEEARYAEPEYAAQAYGIFAERLKKSATTRAVIFATRHRAATQLLMELLEKTGLITYVGKVNMDREAPKDLAEESAEASARETAAWLGWAKGRFERTRPILTPRFIPSCSRELLEKLRQLRADYDLPVQSHLSENPGEVAFVKSLFPEEETYGGCYDRYDLFGRKPGSAFTQGTIMAHCVYSSEKEIALMKQNGVFVAHCPASNTNLASGIAPIRKYLEQGLHLGLGSDVAGGQTESIFRAAADAVQVSKLYWRLVDEAQKPLRFDEAFFLATKGGGAFFGKVGSFEEGYELDALVLDDSHVPHPQALTLRQRLERFAYLGGEENGVAAKFVAGRRIF